MGGFYRCIADRKKISGRYPGYLHLVNERGPVSKIRTDVGGKRLSLMSGRRSIQITLRFKDMDASSSGRNWFFRYKIYHLPFWFGYHYIWWTLTIGDPFQVANHIVSSPYAVKYCFYVIFEAIGVYFNLYYL